MPTLTIMQPYFFPYIGYFQLMHAADEFVVYDRIEYSKGWINRNRILLNGQADYVSLPLKKDSDYLDIADRRLSDTWPSEQRKMLGRLEGSYRKAPHFQEVFPLLQRTFQYEHPGLFEFLLNALMEVRSYLDISTPMVISSSVEIDSTLRSEQRVMAICKARKADRYLNPIGGVTLYNKEEFARNGITLEFLKANEITYTQFDKPFVPSLSIIDVMMFNPPDRIRGFLSEFTLQ